MTDNATASADHHRDGSEPSMKESLPRFVSVNGDPRGALIHYDATDRRWRAASWQGSLGAFASAEAAEAAIRNAPPRPRLKRPPRQETPSPMRWLDLTAADRGCKVRNEQGHAIGAVLPVGERFAAWVRDVLIGEFDTLGQARSAIFNADRSKRKRNSRPDGGGGDK
jgi:hypothetical protein